MGDRFFEPRKLFLYALLAATSMTSSGFSNAQGANPKEALMLRRITEYWKDGDYATVKAQVIDFLERNPESSLQDHLNAMLGDLYFQERNFQQALTTYGLIENPEIQEKTFFNHLQAHFEMRDYVAVMQKAGEHIKEHRGSNSLLDTKVRYLLAESCFRHALKCKDLEQKVFYLKMAKPHYKMLTQTKYGDRTLFPLAEIHRLLREDDRAASLYFNLAKKYPEHAERFLFQAAILQIKENKPEAAKTFKQVYDMGGKRSRLAAFNRLILLYQTEKYETFLTFHKDVISLMPEQKVALLNFYEGRCLYALGDYQQAILPLESFISATQGKSKELKTAFLLLVNCSRYLKDVALVERTLSSYKTAFPNDSEVPKVLMVHAQMCRESGDFAQALADLKVLTSEYPNHEEAEAVMYDYGLLLSQTDRWGQAREMFLSFVEKYPQSEKRTTAWRHLLNCSIEELRSPDQQNPNTAREAFITVLKHALEDGNVLSAREEQQYSLLMMKCLCELDRHEETIPMLTKYVTDVTDQKFLAEAHLLLAICHQKLDSNLALFIEHGESALKENPELTDNHVLHLELYNAYLTRSDSDENVDQANYLERSAEHLFASGAWKDRSIKLDNHLWLANHFYKGAKEGCKNDLEKAHLLFANLLGTQENEGGLNISSDSLYLEAEVLKFAHLLEIGRQTKEQIALLEKLVRKQEESNKLPWKLKRRTALELAKAYEAAGESQRALSNYQSLIKTDSRPGSLVTNTAQLHAANLEYQLFSPQQRSSKSPEMVAVLHTLKDLQIQKKLLAEPIHLEAALRYAEIRSSLSEQSNQTKNTHFFYKRMFEDFHNMDDPITKEYTKMREANPEHNALFGAYMRYLDAQMLRCHAESARSENLLSKAMGFEREAMDILNELSRHEEYLKPYLLERVQKTKAAVAQNL